MSFQSLGLSDALVRAVAEQGYTRPTPIQAQAIPAVLAGGDLLAGAQTGTGKTAGFVLPMLQRMSTSSATHAPSGSRGARTPVRALIVTPTRELAAQVEASIRTYGRHLRFKSMTLFGGVGFGGQAAQLKRGVDIVVATPGRLLDHAQQGNLDLSKVEILVLDEADRMLDMGFLPDIRRILALLPAKRQNLLFSATFPDEIRALAGRLLDRPRTIEVTPPNSTVDVIRQKVFDVGRDRKRELLSWMIGRNRWSQVLVFTRTKHGADKLAQALERDGIRAQAIHGNKSQGARTKALADFKEGGVHVLVATDIAARGIDIDQLPRVVNYDLPNVPEDYVHRIGRTGRAGADGEAISLVCVDEHAFLRDIERLIRRTIPRETVAGFEPDPGERAQPVFRQQRGRGQQHAPGANHASARKPGAPRGGSHAQSRGHAQGDARPAGRSGGHTHGAARGHAPAATSTRSSGSQRRRATAR
ncbi:ATP-dependent RNA helicase RhlE [Burkholderiales bacterium]|nr:ATP-dependent RNA helicase RhlE [Burkholderiales bacterium]